MKYQARVFCDFDGTISQLDVVDFLLSRLADPSWNDIEDEWLRGEIGSRECMERQIPLIRGGWQAVESLLDEVELDPTFLDFALWCESKEIPLVIVSEGLDRVIQTLLKRENIRVTDVWANELLEKSSGELSIRFPYSPQDKDCRAGLCKCQFLPPTELLNVVIGDGRNDFCWAGKADWVFAKSKLLAYCGEFQIPHEAFYDFEKVRLSLELVLEKKKKILSPEIKV